MRIMSFCRHMELVGVIDGHEKGSDHKEEEFDGNLVVPTTGSFSPVCEAKWASRLRGGIAQKWKRKRLAARLHSAFVIPG